MKKLHSDAPVSVTSRGLKKKPLANSICGLCHIALHPVDLDSCADTCYSHLLPFSHVSKATIQILSTLQPLAIIMPCGLCDLKSFVH